MKHTLGPWMAHEYGEAVFAKGKRICVTASQGTVANKETEANCKLIAAAPELLDMVIELRGWFETKQRLDAYPSSCEDIVKRIDQIIKKATQ